MNLSEYWLALCIAAVAGLLMAVQGSINSALGKVTGVLEATLLVHIVGVVFAAALLLGGLRTGQIGRLTAAPWWTYLGGILSVALTYGVARTIPQVGAAVATTAIIVGQVATAALIDHLGLFGLESMQFHWINGLGLTLLAAGAYCLLR
jgi:transporter family-2 protein